MINLNTFLNRFFLKFDANKYIEAQNIHYDFIIEELNNAKKMTHWIWFVFPQIKGLGYSENSIYYAIENKKQALAYLNNSVLNERLHIFINILLKHQYEKNIIDILGEIDSLKFQSSMTLFAIVSNDNNSIFQKALDAFYDGKYDESTKNMII